MMLKTESENVKFKSGISENSKAVEKRNLGELFREAKMRNFKQLKNEKKQPFHTGISYLNLIWNKGCKQGFQWRYTYIDGRNKKRTITRVDLLELKQEVLNRGLEWKIISTENAHQTAKKANVNYSQLL